MPARHTFWERARHPDHARMRAYAAKTPTLWVWLLLVAIAGWQIFTDPLGFSNLTQTYSQDITNLAIVGPVYPTTGRENVSVMLIDDSSLAKLGMTWPWAYGDHARALDALLAYQPKAVVVDILFADARPDPSLAQLRTEIQRYARAHVPLYFVGAPSLAPLQPPVRPEIADSGARIVDPTITFDHGVAREYPTASVCLDASVRGQPAGAKDCPSLALRVYEDTFGHGATASHDPESHLELVWGIRTNPLNRKWMRVVDEDGVSQPCPEDYGVVRRIYLSIVNVSALRSRCPYTGVIPAEALMSEGDDPDIEELVHNRVVFYGASLEGSVDQAFSPANGLIAGVYVHAMALDNLITFKGKAKRDTVRIFGDTISHNYVELFTVALILLILTMAHIGDIRLVASADPAETKAEHMAAHHHRHKHLHGAMHRMIRYLFVLTVVIAAGVMLYTFFGLSIGNWVEMVFIAGVLLEFLISPLLVRMWSYLRYVAMG